MYCSTENYGPSSSPPSSPSLCPDSSPPSSPMLEPGVLSADDSESCDYNLWHDTPAMDPLAASFKANKTPPSYDVARYGKRSRPSVDPQSVTPKKARRKYDNLTPAPILPHYTSTYVPRQSEEDAWEGAIEHAMSSGSKNIELTDKQLTSMPKKFVCDLAKIVVLKPDDDDPFGRRQFARSHTMPASTQSRAMGDRAISSTFLSPIIGDNIRLFLSSNSIYQLPLELWGLKNLTVLALRNNNLSYLPPEIARLQSLESLTVANNKLKFVPAEMLEMRLQTLVLHPNPFLSPPASDCKLRLVSETTQLFQGNVPPLVELCLRRILSQHPSYFPPPSFGVLEPTETLLSVLYDQPLPDYFRDSLPSHLRSILEACVPGSVVTDNLPAIVHTPADGDQVTGIGICPNPVHRREGRVFASHAEQRFTWESIVAGKSTGGAVPVRWRGCLTRCLDFLSPRVEENDETNDEEGGDPAAVVQTLQLGGDIGGFGEEDDAFAFD